MLKGPKEILSIFSLLLLINCYSQSYSITYHRKYFDSRDIRKDAKQQLPLSLEQINRINKVSNSRIIVCSLDIFKEKSIFRYTGEIVPEEYKKWTQPIPPEHLDIGHFYKNRQTDLFNVVNGRVPKNKIVEENLSEINQWILTEQDSVINKMLCKKAVNKVDNNVAWYTIEIPIAEGPLQYAGLPGLIILLIDHEQEYFFEFSELKKKELGEEDFKMPVIEKKITLDDFNKIMLQPIIY